MTASVVVESKQHGRVAHVRFAFSERNTFTLAGVRELDRALAEIRCNGRVRCIIFSSGAPGYFSDGFSLEEMFGPSAQEQLERNSWPVYRTVVEVYRRLIETPVPTVSFVDGVCRGAGLEWAMNCDFIVASNRSEFALHEVRLGIVPGLGGVDLLLQRTGQGFAVHRLLSAKSIGAREALDAGLIDALADNLDEAVTEFVGAIARRVRSALVQTKAFVGTADKKREALARCEDTFIQTLKACVLSKAKA